MKTIRGIVGVSGLVGVLIGGSIFSAHAQTLSASAPADALSSSLALATAVKGLSAVSLKELPYDGTYWLVTREGGFLIPFPGLPELPSNTPVFSLGSPDQFLVDTTGGVAPQPSWRQARHGITADMLLNRQVNAVLDLIDQVQSAQFEAELSAMFPEMSLRAESDGGEVMTAMGYGPDDLWLELTAMTNTTGVFAIHPPVLEVTNCVYDLFLTTNLNPLVPGLNGTNWQWALRTAAGQTNLVVTNLTADECFFRLGKTNDSDGDGLTDAFEKLVCHSNPANVDTDGDGWLDGIEVLMGTDPATSDLPLPVFSATTLLSPASESGVVGQFLITRSVKLTTALSCYYDVSGSAGNGDDYDYLSGEAQFAAGQTNAIIIVTPINDAEFEGDETVTLTLLPDFRYTLGVSSNASLTIVDNDKPTVSVLAADSSVSEMATNAGYFKIIRTGTTSNSLTLSFSLTGTATNGLDYTLLNTNITIAAGIDTVAVGVIPANNTNYWGDRSVILTLKTNAAYLMDTTASNALMTITDDELPTVQVLAADSDAREGSPVRDGKFRFIRNSSLGVQLTVAFTVHGTATPGIDYEALPDSVTIPAGTNSIIVTVHPTNDAASEYRETVIAVLRGSSDYRIGTTNSATVFIDDAGSPAYEWEVLKTSAIGETTINLPAEIVVRRRGPTLSDASFQLTFATNGGVAIPPTNCVSGNVSNNASPFLPSALLRYWVLFTNRATEAHVRVNRLTNSTSVAVFPSSLQLYVTNLFGTAYQELFFLRQDRLFRISFLTNQIVEGGPGTVLRISRSVPAAFEPPLPVFDLTFHVDGTAKPGVDHNLAAAYTFTFPGTAQSVDIPIQAYADNLQEGWESVYARLNLLDTTYAPDTRSGSNWVAALNILDPSVIGPVTLPDSDGDGMSDDFERVNGTDPFVFTDPYRDSDGDGMPDAEESLYGTNPHSRDSDGDGIDDYTEWTHGSSPTDAAQHTISDSLQYARVKLATASCYKCHQTTLSAGQYRLTSVPPIRGNTADSTRREQIFQFLKGQAYPIQISGSVIADTNGQYTAQISAVDNPPGFFVDDPQGMLGTALPVSSLASKIATLIVPQVTLTAPAVIDLNNNFDEGKTGGGLRVADSVDASPFGASGELQIAQHGALQISVTPNLTNLYAYTTVTLAKSYIGLATNVDHADIRVIALNATNGWREIAFGEDIGPTYLSMPGTNHTYNRFYMEGLAAGMVKLQVQLNGGTYAEQLLEVCTHTNREGWRNETRNEIYFDTGGTVAVENYLASNGFMNNRANILGVYGFYEKLFTERPTQFYWAGLAKLAGAPVYAGLSDAENLKSGGFVVGGSLGVPAAIAFGLFGKLYSQAFQNDLVQMNISIYNDLAWQFEAYRMGGLCALEAVAATDPKAVDISSWQLIDQGIRENNLSKTQDGNRALLQREQQKVLADGYAALNSLPKATSLMTHFAKNPVPTGANFLVIVPNGNIADYPDRWRWITTNSVGMWPLWLTTPQSTQLQWVGIPLKTRAVDYSLAKDWWFLSLPIK